ncbi:hypothetical protein LDFHOB_11340 [Candidatus Electronema aureum]
MQEVYLVTPILNPRTMDPMVFDCRAGAALACCTVHEPKSFMYMDRSVPCTYTRLVHVLRRGSSMCLGETHLCT